MAIVEIKVPQFSESVSEGTLLDWKKKVGEAIAQDETVIEVETDKVVLEVPAPAAGVLVEVTAAAGDTVTSEQIIAKIDTDAKAGAAAPVAAKPAEAAAPAAAASSAAPVAGGASGGIASPAAAKVLAEKNLSTTDVAGSGRDGRVTKGDALAAGAKPAAVASSIPAPAPRAALPSVAASVGRDTSLEGRPEQRVPMSRLRARIAERLLQSQQTNAILTTFNEVNMKPVMDLRNKYKDKFEKEHGVKLGFMSFFVKAAVHALKKYPAVNASIDGNDIVYHGYFDIGIAVGSPRGLVVPILRNADQLSLADIEKKIADRRNDRRYVLDLERRHLRLDAVDPDHQPAAIGHSGRARHEGPRGRGERRDRHPPDGLPGHELRPPYHRRSRSRAEPRRHEGSAGRSGAPAARPVSDSAHCAALPGHLRMAGAPRLPLPSTFSESQSKWQKNLM